MFWVLFVCMSVFLIARKLMNGSFLFFYVGRTWQKEEVIKFLERSGSYSEYQNQKVS